MIAIASTSALHDPQAVMDHHAKSFSWAARFLSAPARRDAALLYAFARTADDFADEADLGSLQERNAALRDLRKQALEPVFPINSLANQTGSMLRDHGVPHAVLETLMDSLQADIDARQIDTTDNLLLFAYGVAGTVGQMMRPLLGAPPSADACAISLGVAMQLTNIARDVVEDAQRGRCYVPSEWGLTLRGMSAPRSAEERSVAFTALQRLLALSDDFYAFARSGISAIPRHNRRAIRIAAALYQGIGRKILRQGPNLYWQGRTFLTRPEKIRILAQTLLLPELPMRKSARDVWHDDLAHLVGVPGFPSQRHA
jgi:phytoene synthase